MSNFEIAAMVLAGLWLGALTLVVLLLVRQLGLVTLRLDMVGGAATPPADGPEIGSEIPPDVIGSLPQLAEGLTYLLLISPTCVPCRELAPQLGTVRLEGRVVALVPGRPEVADDMVAQLPRSFAVMRDPEAAAVAERLGLELTPAALEVEDGVVSGKAYLTRAADLQQLIDARAHSDANEIVRLSRTGRS